MEQSFSGPINGDVAGRDVVNQIITETGRPLTTQERGDLNAKVKILEKEYGEVGWKTWKYLHRTIGVNSVDEMLLSHRDAAHAILDLLLELGQAKKGSVRKEESNSAEQLADLVCKNSELNAKLKEAQRLRNSAELQARALSDAHAASRSVEAQLRADMEALNKTAHGLIDRNRQEGLARNKAVRRSNRSLAAAVFLALTTGAASFYAYGQAHQLKLAQAERSLCWLDGKAHSPGSVIDADPDQECVKPEGNQVARWEPVAAKKKPSRRKMVSSN